MHWIFDLVNCDMSLDAPTSQRWLAYELHDGLLQWVIGARLQLIAALGRNQPSLESCQRAMNKAISSLEMGLFEARQLIGYLEQQPARGQTRLASVLAQFIEVTQRDAELHDQTLQVRIDLGTQDQLDQMLTDAVSWNLLRIAQQAIRNAITHAGPTQISVQLYYVVESKQITLVVEDHGRGFESSQPQTESQHFGLSSMSHRAQLIGARLEIQSNPGAGCCVTCTLPMAVTKH